MVRYDNHVISISQDKCQSDPKPIGKSPEQSSSSFEWSMDSDFSFHNSITTTDYDFPSADDLFREGKILPMEVKKEIPIPFQPLCALLNKIVKNERIKGHQVVKILKIEKQKKDKDWETKKTATSSKQSQLLQQSTNLPPCRPLHKYIDSTEANANLRHKEKKKLQRKTKTTSRNEEGIPEKEVSELCWQRKRSTNLSFSTLDHKATLRPTIPRLSRNITVSSGSSPSNNQLTTSRDGQKHLQNQQKIKPLRNYATPSHKKTVDSVCLEKNHVCRGVGTPSPYGHPVIVPLVDLHCQSSDCFSCKSNRNKK